MSENEFEKSSGEDKKSNARGTVVLFLGLSAMFVFLLLNFLTKRGMLGIGTESGFDIFALAVTIIGATIGGYLLLIRSEAAETTARMAISTQITAAEAQQLTTYASSIDMLSSKHQRSQMAGIQLLSRLVSDFPDRYFFGAVGILTMFSKEACTDTYDPISNAIEAHFQGADTSDRPVVSKILKKWPRTNNRSLIAVGAASSLLTTYSEEYKGLGHKHIFDGIIASGTVVTNIIFTNAHLMRWLFDDAELFNCTFNDVTIDGFVRPVSNVEFNICTLSDCNIELLNPWLGFVEAEPCFCSFKNCIILDGVSINGEPIARCENYTGDHELPGPPED